MSATTQFARNGVLVTQRPHLSVTGDTRRASRRYVDIVLGTVLLIFATTFMVLLAIAVMPIARLGHNHGRRASGAGHTAQGLQSRNGGTDALRR